MQLKKWPLVEESITRQKIRVQWLRLGDSNTKFFFACMKNIEAHNHIRSLVDEQGRVLQNDKAVEEKITGYYKHLLGSSTSQLPCIQAIVMRNGHVLKREQQLKLIASITQGEVSKVIREINDQKAHGCDGFIVLFFKRVWPIA